jgi:hypothetical protein
MVVPAQNIVESVDLTPRDALLPLFETIVNSVISLIKTDLPVAERAIEIEIIRGNPPNQINIDNINTINSISITDNGVGFDEANYKSFETPLTKYNKEFGCKGVGRFTALAAFSQIRVTSNYKENDVWMHREFDFDAENEVIPKKLEPSLSKVQKTTVELVDCYNPVIKDRTAIKLDEIAQQIMHHCLIYYLNDSLPKIKISDSATKKPALINSLFEKVSKENERSFDVQNQSFKAYITKTPKEGNRKFHYVYYCANSRVVGQPKNIGKINTLFNFPLNQNGHQYFLDVYVVSEYLNSNVVQSRNAFTIQSDNELELDFLGIDEIISFQDIETELVKTLEDEYAPHVVATKEASLNQIKNYIKTQAPRYRSLLRKPELLNTIPPHLSDDKKEEHLYKLAFSARKNVEKNLQEFIDTKQINEQTILKIKEDIQEKTAYDTDSLADYMMRRKAIIELFDRFLEADKEGTYKLEEDIHNLIFPRGITSDEIDYESHNLWLLDERFVTFKFIASDKSITSFSQKKSAKEPDVIMMNDKPLMFDNPIGFGDKNNGELSSMVIFEFKRPGSTAHQKKNTDFRWNYSELVEPYFDEFLYNANKKNYKGKQVILTKETPKFGYIIVDVLPPLLKEYNQDKGWKRTPFDTYYFIKPELNLHLEVMTFTKLIEHARQRHVPFFDKLFGL